MRKRLSALTPQGDAVMRMQKCLFIGLLSALTLGACAELNEDINRVHPPYVKKDTFDGTWYYKTMVIDAAPTNQWASPGDGMSFFAERIRWKISEAFLIGYRDFEYVAGSETREIEGSDYYGSPVVMYAIKEHFDIRRSYNPQTGEETNVWDKNLERPWNERDYVVVDWSQNLSPTWGIINWTFGIPISQITSSAYYVQPHEIDNPDRARISSDYIDVVGKYTLWPDLLGCLYGEYGVIDCAPGEVHVRHSFLKVDPSNDYQPMPFPDSVDLVDANGDFVRENGKVIRVPIFERFGAFRLERATYDPDYELTESGRLNRASRFNLWERSTYDDGTEIPYHLRTPKPVVLYLNVEFPEDDDMSTDVRQKWNLKRSAYLVGENWNVPFKRVVAMLRVMSRNGSTSATKAEIQAELLSSDMPEKMFEVRDNSCNQKNVEDYVAAHKDLEQALNTYIGGLQRLNKQNLPKACTVLESLTEDNDDAFTWERHGDLRHHMLIYINKHQEAGWGGLADMAMDPVTGEAIAINAHFAGRVMERGITWFLDYIDSINGELSDYDLVTGQDVRSYLNSVRQRADRNQSAEVSDTLVNEMNRRFTRLGNGPQNLLREISPSLPEERLQRIQGTALEDLVMNDNDWKLARKIADPALAAGVGDVELRDIASPVRAYRRDMEQRQARRDRELLKRGRTPITQFYDSILIGLALDLRDKTREERRAILRYKLFEAYMNHEVGHTVGERHNFSASTDALNYFDSYWEIAKMPQDLDAALAQLNANGDLRAVQVQRCIDDNEEDASRNINTLECLQGTEMKYASIMDYTGRRNGDHAGLGKYDDAYVYFLYGGILEVFDDDAIAPAARAQIGSGKQLRDWLFYNDYKKIPDVFSNGVEGLKKRHYEKYSWGPRQTTQPEPVWTVPYKFCSDEWSNDVPDCRTGDWGTNQSEIAEAYLDKFHEYYFFTHFNRNQANYYWYWDAANANLGVMRNLLMTYQYMYLYRSLYPDFFDSDTGRDYLKASVMGLNLYGEILGLPANGDFSELDADDGILVNSQRDGFWRVEESAQWLGGGTSNLLTSGGLGVMVPSSYLNSCDSSNTSVNIPLGEGRPFSLGLSADYEDWVFTYVGSYFDKDNALRMLAYPRASFLPIYAVGGQPAYDPRTYSVNYFRLFRNEVLELFYGAITNDLSHYAPIMRKTGSQWNFEPRAVLNLDGSKPDYTPSDTVKLILPSTAANIPYNALLYGMAFMSNLLDGEEDFTHITKIAVRGQEDDIADYDRIPMYDSEGVQQKAEFTHPLTGLTYRALRQSDTPIAFRMVQEANRRKDRWAELQRCVDEPDRITGECECVYQAQTVDQNGAYTCRPGRETTACIMQDRLLRVEKALEYLEKQVELMNNVRKFQSLYEYRR